MATGDILSTTVTMELHVLEFPLSSVAVTVTTLGPTSSHVKVFWDTSVVMDASPHGSVGMALKSVLGSSTTVPALSKYRVALLQAFIVGPSVSCMVTTASQESLFPDSSTTISVTELAPILVQLKKLGSTNTESIMQLSKLPPLTSCASNVYSPNPFNCTVIS